MIVKRLIRSLLVIVVVVAAVGGGRALMQRKKKALAAAPKFGVRPMPVRVAVARKGELRKTHDYLAVVEPVRLANISARLTATIEKITCDEGDSVKAGAVMILLDGQEIREDIAGVEAQIEQAKADLSANEATVVSLSHSLAYWEREAKRDKTLAEKGDIPGAQAEGTADKASEFKGKLDAARQKSRATEHVIESLRRKKSQLETQLGYCTIRSPYDGLVTRRLVDPGDLASPGKTLMVVEDRSQLKLSFDVPQQDLPRVHEGLDVTFSVGGEARRAQLSHMYPSLNVARMLRAEVNLDGAAKRGLSCGAYVPVSVVLGRTENVTLIPAACLIEGPKRKVHLFTVREGKLVPVEVKVLGTSGEMVAVEGIKPGEQVATNTFLGWARLSAGVKVEIVQ